MKPNAANAIAVNTVLAAVAPASATVPMLPIAIVSTVPSSWSPSICTATGSERRRNAAPILVWSTIILDESTLSHQVEHPKEFVDLVVDGVEMWTDSDDAT